jgi:hypothetical protein
MLLASLLIIAYLVLLWYTLEGALFKKRIDYLLYYLAIFLPVYTIFLCLIYQGTDSEIITKIIQYSKEIVILTFLLTLFITRKEFFQISWNWHFMDRLFILFILLSLIYLIVPIGEASFINKAVYFKNILLFCLMYFFGRISTFSFKSWRKVFKIVFIISTIAFIVVVFEKTLDTHLHHHIGYAKYNLDFNDIEMKGYYGLTWTFEADGGQKRFGSIFSDPLEFSASLLLSLSAAIIFFLSVPHSNNKTKYFILILITIISLALAYSRASFVAFIAMLFFMGIALKFYRLIISGIIIVAAFSLYIIFFAPQETKFFVEDTLLFQNSSSITHLIDWFNGIDAMIENPMGLGLATSGNIRGVEEDLRVGGENQFLIFGVQLGIIGLLIYTLLYIFSIIYSLKAFRLAKTREDQIIPFVASTVKFGLLLPLFTSNAEAYLYISFLSWWMVGYSINIYQANKKKLEIIYANSKTK